MTRKLGKFFLIMGILMLIVFVYTIGKSPTTLFYFCFGDAILFGLAIILLRRSRAEQPKSERFSLLRKLFWAAEEEEE